MKTDENFVPTSVKEAVDCIIESLTPEDKDEIEKMPSSSMVHHTVGRHLRNSWSLWERDTALRLNAVNMYGIAHPDDISGLVLEWVFSTVKGLEFSPHKHCERYHAHWKMFGTDSLTAGGYGNK